MSARLPIVIRQLTPDDITVLEAMSTMFGNAFDEVETYCASRPSSDYLDRLLRSDYFIALCAILDQEVVGGIAAYELPKFEQERSEIYIYDLAVAAPLRRQGIATAMINELVKVAASRGAYLVFVQADDGDVPASELYGRFGVREAILHFDIPIRR